MQAIGAAETKLFDFGAPKRIDGDAATKLVNVAKDLNVQQYVMVSSLGTGKVGFPASECCIVPSTLTSADSACFVSSCCMLAAKLLCIMNKFEAVCWHDERVPSWHFQGSQHQAYN